MKRRSVNKYRNKKTVIDGITFDSKKERNRYLELKILQRAGKISGLELQPKFEIVPKVGKYRARFYIADFLYRVNGNVIVEDVKSAITKKNPVYTLKRQLFLHRYGRKYIFLEI